MSISTKQLIFRNHAIKRMAERGISIEDVRYVLTEGKIIQSYLEDVPYPSYLILGWPNKRPIHVVAAENKPDSSAIIIAVYELDPEVWSTDFERKK